MVAHLGSLFIEVHKPQISELFLNKPQISLSGCSGIIFQTVQWLLGLLKKRELAWGSGQAASQDGRGSKRWGGGGGGGGAIFNTEIQT